MNDRVGATLRSMVPRTSGRVRGNEVAMSPRARRLHLLLAIALGSTGLAGCIENGLSPKFFPNAPADTATSSTDSGIPTDTALTADCPEGDGLATSVSFDESCQHEAVSGPLEAVVEWSFDVFGNYGEYNELLGTPVVGQLSDDNLDGFIDEQDIPDIVFVADDHGTHNHRKGILRVIQGDGLNYGSAIAEAVSDGWQVYPYRYSNTAIGDIDNDGVTEIVIISQVIADTGGGDGGGDGGGGGSDTAPPADGGGDGGPPGGGDTGGSTDNPVGPPPPLDEGLTCRLSAWNASGELEWLADAVELTCSGHAPSIADLDGDGAVEVVVGPYIFDGATGAIEAQGAEGQGFYPSNLETGMHSVVADLDMDGAQEVIAGPTRYDATGAVICTAAGVDDGFVAVADFDLDGAGEWVVTANGQVTVMDTDCSVMAVWALSGGGNGGPPTVADFDADLAPEIGIADAGAYAVYEPSGALLWSMPVTDASSHTTGSSVFDFEGDGYPEVVYADETRLWVFAGGTGEVRLEDDRHASRTLHEYPTIVDVDRDGSSEIVVPNGGGHQDEGLTGLYILGPAFGSWNMSRQVWNQHAYSITNINEDLSVPAHPVSNWPTHNNFRSGDLTPPSGSAQPDAVPLAEVCVESCGAGTFLVNLRLGNSGAGGLRGELPVSIYNERADGLRTLITTVWTTDSADKGHVTSLVTVEIDVASVPDGTLVFVADDFEGQSWVSECREDNNEQRVEGVVCP